jgi:hypothetical protein
MRFAENNRERCAGRSGAREADAGLSTRVELTAGSEIPNL